MRQTHRYAKKTSRDVTTPEDLCTALHHEGGINNCAEELISVWSGGERLQRWRDGVRRMHTAPLKKVGRFQYGSVIDGAYQEIFFIIR